jgi:phosphopentomutase
MSRAIILILDSLGIGASKDAVRFGDEGANTLGHIAKACETAFKEGKRKTLLFTPHLNRLGLGHACEASSGYFPAGFNRDLQPMGAYGYGVEISSGKDTPSGHWEIAGVPVLFEWGYFTNKTESFPRPLLEKIVQRANLPGFLGNCHASGTTILDQLGAEHIKTGKPIFYTSADSVFQIACHEHTFGLERLYALCQIVREEVNVYNIGRVIARPFIGTPESGFTRTGNRHDYAVPPPAPTVLQKLTEAGAEVVSIGKIADIYAHVGITQTIKATGIEEIWDATLKATQETRAPSIIMSNFVDFDSSYGHRRDTLGYADALEQFDLRLPQLLACLGPQDILIISADHGCDPTHPGSDHTREHIPILAYGSSITPGSIGRRETFADIGQSLAHYFRLSPMQYGTRFL